MSDDECVTYTYALFSVMRSTGTELLSAEIK